MKQKASLPAVVSSPSHAFNLISEWKSVRTALFLGAAAATFAGLLLLAGRCLCFFFFSLTFLLLIIGILVLLRAFRNGLGWFFVGAACTGAGTTSGCPGKIRG